MTQSLTAPRGRRRSARAHQAILRAAVELVGEEGYGRLSIEAIAARAGVGKQTIYRWWPSKGAVVLDAFRDALAANALWIETGNFGADVEAQMRRLAEAFANPALGPPIAALVGEAQHDPVFAEAFHQRIVAPSREVWREIFSRARAAGEVRDDLDLDLAIDLLLAPFWYRLLLRAVPWSDLDSAALSDAVLRAIRPPTGTGPSV